MKTTTGEDALSLTSKLIMGLLMVIGFGVGPTTAIGAFFVSAASMYFWAAGFYAGSFLSRDEVLAVLEAEEAELDRQLAQLDGQIYE